MIRVSKLNLLRFSFAAMLASAFLTGGALQAKHYRIYIHGYSTSQSDANKKMACHKKTSCSRVWTGGKLSNARFVGWAGNEPWVRDYRAGGFKRGLEVLYKYCTSRKSNTCSVITHSTGASIIGKILDYKKRGSFNIRVVVNLAGAEGGTKLANGLVSSRKSSHPSYWLRTDVMRRTYDHDDTNGVTIYSRASLCNGSWGGTPHLYGWNDGVIAGHSSCARRKMDKLKSRACGSNSRKKWDNHKSKAMGKCYRHTSSKVKGVNYQKPY